MCHTNDTKRNETQGGKAKERGSVISSNQKYRKFLVPCVRLGALDFMINDKREFCKAFFDLHSLPQVNFVLQ
jgi:hypothetical protein